MKYIKKFKDNTALETYKKSNFVTPHIYLDSNLNTVKYMEEYQQLEYISSTQVGHQYVDLGCKLLENTDDIEIDIKFKLYYNNANQTPILSSQYSVNPYPGFTIRNTDDTYIEGFSKWQCSSTVIYNKNRYYFSGLNSNIINNQITNYSYINDIHEHHILLDNIPASQITNIRTSLFCYFTPNGDPDLFAIADLYYLKFTKGGQVIRNLIPVKKVSTNEIGLYDMENDHLYVSQGDEPFVAGPNK